MLFLKNSKKKKKALKLVKYVAEKVFVNYLVERYLGMRLAFYGYVE